VYFDLYCLGLIIQAIALEFIMSALASSWICGTACIHTYHINPISHTIKAFTQ